MGYLWLMRMRSSEIGGIAHKHHMTPLRQFKKNLVRQTVQENGEVLDIQDLDAAVSRTENRIRRHADDYLKTINNQVLTLPCIEEAEQKPAPAKLLKWQPPYETIPNTHPLRCQIPGPSPEEKHKSAFIIRLLNNSFHPKNKEIGQQNYGIQLLHLHKRARVGTQRVVTGPTLGSFTAAHEGLPKHLQPKPPPEYRDMNAGLLPSAADLSSVQTPVQPKAVHVLQREDSSQSKRRVSLFPQLPAAVSKYPFTMVGGQIDPDDPDYCRFKKQCCLYWGAVVEALDQLQWMLLDFVVPLAWVCEEGLAVCVQSGEFDWRDGRGRCTHVEKLLSVLENRDEVWDLMCQPGQCYRGIEGHRAAAVCIQTCWRLYSARTAYLLQLRPKWAAQIIAMSLLKHAKLTSPPTRKPPLAAKWKHITSAKRTIIHVTSLGYSQHQRLSLRDLMYSRIPRWADYENVEVIYVSPVRLGEDVLQYYTRLLGLQTAIELGDASVPESHCAKRFTILMPEALEHFSTQNMCLASVLKYRPRTLQGIKNLIQGKQAYMFGGVTHIDDLAVADELKVPLLGIESAVTQLYSTKPGGRRIFSSAGVDMPPGKWDIYTLEQLHEALARLMTEHMEVQQCLCLILHLSVILMQESVMIKFLDEVLHLLASCAHPANTSCYATWACFLEHFLREGGVIEAFPPLDSVTCLTVDLLVEPGEDVHMLGLEVVGCTVPQTSICPDVLHTICTRVGQACQQRSIMGHISLDLVTFLHSSNLEQQVWAIDLDLGYSNQLAMTQLMLMMTRGMLDCCTSKLEVPPPVRDVKSSIRNARAKTKAQTSVTNRFAVMCTRLLHTNLSLVYYSTFFLMCKAQGIGYDVKARQGTVFALHDSRDRRSLGMLTISEDLQGALLTFAHNLSIIHQEISAPNMRGANNFKEEKEITAPESEQLSSHKPHRSTPD
uniref:IQ motif containing H n=1 Tax=Cyprinus carpio TaxID=7962 RepID=A0A8C1JZ77_CYPCA